MRRLVSTVLLALVLVPAAAAATKGPVFGLRAVGNPKLGYFVYPLSAGASKQGGVIVSNTGTATGTVKLFSADATTGRTTGTVYETDRRPSRVGTWITLSASSLVLKPGAHKTVTFTVRVPPGEKPGQWVGGIVAETSHQVTGAKSKQKASVQIKIRDLTIVAVQVNVPGPPVVDFSLGGVKTGGQRGFQELVTHIANNGNVLVKPKGTVTVLNKQGKVLQVLTFTMDTFLPQTAVDYPILLKKALPPGDYTANISLTVPGVAGAAGKVVTAKPAFSVSKQDVKQVFTSATPQAPPPGVSGSSGSSTPWALIAGLAAAVLVLLLLLWLVLRRRGRKTAAPVASAPRSASAAAAESAGPPIAPPAPLSERTAPPPVPEPFPALPTETAPAAPPAAPVVAQPQPPAPAATHSGCDHLWEVAYDRGQLGSDGVWRFLHRCSSCGLELLARDVADASAQAAARR